MAAKMQPVTVSVTMAVFDAEPYIAGSIEAVLEQTHRDFELILINDGSTDGSLGLLKHYEAADPRVRVVTRANRGVVFTRNELLEMARGEFIAVNDADDVSVRNRLEKQLDYMRAHPECVALGGQMRWVDPDGLYVCNRFGHLTHEEIEAAHFGGKGSVIGHSSVMMRADAARRAGGYREGFDPAEDFDLWLRLAELGRLANLPDVVVSYRLHASSISHSGPDRMWRATRRAVAEACARRGLRAPVWCNPEVPLPPRAPPEAGWIACAWAAGNYSGALRLAIKALRRHPTDPQVWRRAALAALGPLGHVGLRLLRAVRGQKGLG